MDDATFNLKGEVEIPILNLPLSDLWIVLPGVFAFNVVSNVAALGRLAPLFGLVAHWCSSSCWHGSSSSCGGASFLAKRSPNSSLGTVRRTAMSRGGTGGPTA